VRYLALALVALIGFTLSLSSVAKDNNCSAEIDQLIPYASGLSLDIDSASETRVGDAIQANNPQQSWGFEGEPPEAVTKDSGTRVGTS
jgi:hypothetical protein